MDDLDQIKSNPGVIRIYSQYVKGLKKTGDKYVGLCPIHGEKTPSFTVFPDMRFNCFGCSAAGNIFQLLEKVDGQDFKTAVETVKKELGDRDWSEVKQKTESTFQTVTEKRVYRTISLADYKILENNLLNSPQAIQWLEKERGISIETAQRLHIGFKSSLKNVKDPAAADILDKGWIVFPCLDGDVIRMLKFRSIVRKKPGGFQRQYGMETVLFGLESISPFDPLWVVEGEPDRCIMEQAGFNCVSVQFAGDKVSPEMKDRIMEAPEIYLAGDDDGSVGNDCMTRLWKELGRSTYYQKWPKGMKDANQTFLEHCGRDISKFKNLVQELTSKAKSQPMPDIYSIQEVMQNGEDKSLAERTDRLRFPWKPVDEMAILLPGSVLGVMSTSTGQGKTCFTLQFSLSAARKYNEVVINWQCELTPSEIAVMVASQILRKNRNFITKDDLKAASEELSGVQYYVGHSSNQSGIMEVLDIMEAAIRRCGATTAVLDTLHFYTTGIDDEVKMQAAAMHRIKQMAVIYGVKFVVVSHPRKATSQTRGRKTQISDAKGSGSLGDTCDSFMAIHRDLAKETDGAGINDQYEEKTLVEMLKTRSKGIGKSSCYLHFFGEFASFEQLESNYEEALSGLE